MKKGVRILLVLTLVFALALFFRLGIGLRQDQRLLAAKEAELGTSRETWENIAAEKEALQEELKAAENDLKEAKLTLEESLARAETLRAEIASLTLEIESLKASLQAD